MVALVPEVMDDPGATSRTLLPLIEKPLGRRINLCALVRSARQTLVPLNLAIDAEALAAFYKVVASHCLPVQRIFGWRDNQGMAAGARNHVTHGLGQLKLQKLIRFTCNRSRLITH